MVDSASCAAKLEMSVESIVFCAARLETSTSKSKSLAAKLEMSVESTVFCAARLETSSSSDTSLNARLETSESISLTPVTSALTLNSYPSKFKALPKLT